MFKNFYTTRMSAKGKTLQTRFMKMRRKNGRFSRIAGAITTLVIVLSLVCALIVCAATDGRKDNEGNAVTNLEISAEQLSEYANRQVGSTMAEVAYVDGATVVFYYLDGVFIYDLNKDVFVRSFDLNKLNCAHFQQGSYGLTITVSADGKTALLVNYGEYDSIKNFKNYRLDLENGIAYETEDTKIENPAGEFVESFGTLPDDEGYFSIRCVRNDGKLYYLTMKEGWKWENIRLVQLDESTGEKRQRYVFKDDDPSLSHTDQIHSVLPEGAEIIVNSGAFWDIRIGDDSDYPELAKLTGGLSLSECCDKLGIAYKEYKGRQLEVYVYAVDFGDGNGNQYLYVFDNERLIASKDMRNIMDEQDLIRVLTYLEDPNTKFE